MRGLLLSGLVSIGLRLANRASGWVNALHFPAPENMTRRLPPLDTPKISSCRI